MIQILLTLLGTSLLPSAAPPRVEPLAWVEVDEGRLVADVIRFSKADEEQVNKLLAKYPVTGDKYYAEVPADEPLLLGAWPIGRRFTLVTTAGPRDFRVGAIGVSYGASEGHYLVRDTRPVGRKRLGGLLIPQVAKPDAKQLRLRELVGKPVAAKRSARILKQLKRQLSLKDREHLESAKVAPDAMLEFEGRFQKRHARLVTLRVSLGDQHFLSAMFFLDGSDRISAMVVRPAMSIEHYTPRYSIDLDGDGVDEIVFDSDYYEGSYRLLMRRRGDGFETITLTGDGA